MRRSLSMVVVLLMSCDGAGPAAGTGEQAAVARVQQPVCGTAATEETRQIYEGLKAECASCHLGGTRGYFASLGAFQELLVADPKIVAPGKPDDSLLIKLLEGRGTGPFAQMPIAGLTYAQRVQGKADELQVPKIREWVTGLATQSRDTRPSATAPRIVRISARQLQRTLYRQLGLTNADFYVEALEFTLPMAEAQGDGKYPLLPPDALPAPRNSYTVERFTALGGGAPLNQRQPDRGMNPTFALTLQQTSQAWCRQALAKSGNVALFPAGTAINADPQVAKATIRRWSLHFLGEPFSDTEVDGLYTDLFVPLATETNATNAYVGLCSFFIRHPLWIFN